MACIPVTRAVQELATRMNEMMVIELVEVAGSEIVLSFEIKSSGSTYNTNTGVNLKNHHHR